MEGTEQTNDKGITGTGMNPFASSINKLESQESTTDQTTTAQTTDQTTIAQTTDQTTVAPQTTDETTQVPEPTIIDYLKQTSGIEGEFENSVDGITSLIAKTREAGAADGLNKKFEQYPVLKQLEEHLTSGKSMESFFQVQQINTNRIEVPKLTSDDKQDAEAKAFYKDVIRANAKAIGLSDKQITRIIDSSDLENTLYEDAVENATSWNERQDRQAQAVIQQEESGRLASIEAEKKLVKTINDIIDVGTLNGATIPQNERPAFKDFILKLDEQGLAERDKAIQSLTTEQWMILDYILFKKFDVKGLVQIKKIPDLGTLKGSPLVNNNGNTGGNAAEKDRLPGSLIGLDFKRLQSQTN